MGDLDEEFTLSNVMTLPPAPEPLERETSTVSDEDFVDKLFTVFANPEDSLLDPMVEEQPTPVVLPKQESILPDIALSKPKEVEEKFEPNKQRKGRPDPELMERLSDALAVLPKEMQESIVERLISSITTTELLPTPELKEDKAEELHQSVEQQIGSPVPPAMPLAAATLAALLSHYSAVVKESKTNSNVKPIPVIPVHA